jgi:hypothetical protein
MAVNDKISILVPLAKELGYKDAKEMRDALGKEEAGRGEKKGLGFGNIGGAGGIGTGFLGGREIGAGFGVGIKSRLAKSASVKEAVSGGFKDFAQTFTAENIKRRTLEKTFGGPGFLSTFVRGKLKKIIGVEARAGAEASYGKKSPTVVASAEKKEDGGKTLSDAKSEQKFFAEEESVAYLGILAKSSLVIPGMARDMNVMRQNIQRLVKLKAGPQKKGEKAYATAADYTKKEKEEMSGKALSDAESERKKDTDFFAEEDKKEAEQEAAKQKKESPTVVASAEKKEDEGSLLGTIIGFLKNGLIGGLKKIFNAKSLLKVLGKVFVIGTIISALFSGIIKAWNTWKETGSLFETFTSFLGGILNFLTFGLLGEEQVKSFFNAISSFLEPLVEGAKNIYYTIKDWIVNNVGIPEIGIPISKTLRKTIGAVTGVSIPEKMTIGPYYPFKSNPRSDQPEYTKRELSTKEDKSADKKTRDLADSKVATPDPSPTPASKEAPKSGVTRSGEKLNFPVEILFDSNTGKYSYKGVSFDTPKNQKELDTIVKAIDDKAVVEYQGVDANDQPVTKAFNGATGEISILPPKQAPSPVTSAPAAALSGGSGGGGASATAGGEIENGASASPSSETSASPPTSGDELSDSSSQIAEAQRMESAADMESSIDASTTNNSSGLMDKTPTKIADVYDSEFVKLYAMA